MLARPLALAALLALLGAAAVPAQDFMPPDRPPPADWQVQGEYFGTVEGGGNLGAWVIGQGGDKYNVVFLPGGLLDIPGQPGGGWDRTTRIAASGSAASIVATNGYKASITGTGEDRAMTGTTNAGKAFTLKRLVRQSPTLGLQPKAEWNAQSWFRANNSADLTKWTANPSAPQLRYGGYLYRGVTCTQPHATLFLHIEARGPYCPTCRDQDRGNSGIYLRGMHEMQVLDSFGLTGANNEAGAVYRVQAPLVNAALPPLTWQTYDCYYTPGAAPNSATFTLYLNGVLVQNKTQVTGITEAGFAGNSLYLQDHGHDVVFNNIWAVANATETSLPYANLLPTVSLASRAPVLAAPKARAAGGLFARPSAASFFDALGRDLGLSGAARLPGARLPAGEDR
jgi:hypothetical protein